MQSRFNVAARAARWSATHRRLAIFGWLAFVVLSIAIGGAVGQRQLTDAEGTPRESGRAEAALERARMNTNDEVVMVQSTRYAAGDPEFDAAIAEAADRLGAVPSVTAIETPLDGGGAVSDDGHAALVEFRIRGDQEAAEAKVGESLDAVAAVQRSHPEFRVDQFGDASASQAIEDVFADDLHKAETTSLPITLLILLVAFGALVAALVPLLLAFSAVLATVSLLALPSQLVPMDPNVASVVVLVGLAVGVDYSLFYLRREREERRAGRSAEAALNAAAATSGRAVLVSGLTVIASMSGMLLAGDPTFTSFAVGTMLVVAVAMLASLSVLPAVLAALGDRVDKGRIPFLGKYMERRRESGRSFWGAVAAKVMRHPVAALLGAGGLLVALAVPALGLNTVVTGPNDFPQDIEIVQVYNRLVDSFPSEGAESVVVVEAEDVDAPPVRGAIAEFGRAAEADASVTGEVQVRTAADGSVAAIAVPTVGDGADDASTAAMTRIREQVVPAAFGGLPGVEVSVTGSAAQSEDFSTVLEQRLPIVFAFVLGLAFLLLLVTFRSIVVPIKAIVLNLLSVGAAYGVLALVFQHGWAEGLLGFQGNGGITPWLPMFLFVILFGLSMDYHVLILSRVREGVDRGLGSDAAVQRGIEATAGTVTSAAAVMVAVFSVFATLSIIDMKEMGVGLAAAVLIDATIVRAVLLPAAMKLLGDRNWYLPRSLRWLARNGAGEPVREAGEPVRGASEPVQAGEPEEARDRMAEPEGEPARA
ncbi:MAG: MMPL family transporter [Solirubrobacterales bacterium]